MSPEQALGDPLDARSDIFSLGVVVYEMLSGVRPFQADSNLATMRQLVNSAPKPLNEIAPGVPSEMLRIVDKALAKEPSERFQSAAEMLRDVKLLLITGGQNGSETVADQSRGKIAATFSRWRIPPARRYMRLWFAIGAVCLLLVIASVTPLGHRTLVRISAPPSGRHTSGVSDARQPKYLAVLPFRVPGDEAQLKEQADGIVEALSAKLFQLQDVHLASSSAVEVALKQETLPKIARYLGVKLLVEGTMQTTGDRIETIVRLEDPETNRALWTQQFRFAPADLLAMEDDIYNKLVAALGIKLSNEDLAHAATRPTEDIDAYGLYLKARSILRGQRNLKTVGAAIDLFNQAVLKDPGFALAYAGLCDADLIMFDLTKEAVWPEKALGAAHQAERLNSNLPEIHVSLGGAYKATGKTAEAIAELKRTLELAPNSDEGYRRLAGTYLDAGRVQEALQMYKKANEVNPYYWVNHNQFGAAYMKIAQYDKAVEEFTRVTQLEPDRATGYINLGVAYYQAGKWNECIPAFEKSIALSPSFFAYNNLAVIYNNLGRYQDAIRVAQKAVEMNANEYAAVANLADAYRFSGQREQAMATYDKAITLAFKSFQVNPRDAVALGSLASYYSMKGDSGQALQFIQRARSIDPDNVSLAYKQAVVCARAGKETEALQSLNEALTKGYSPKEIENNPDLKALRSRPEFQKLLSDVSGKSK
jgi:tetratricopeptide (TPR) repeat protein